MKVAKEFPPNIDWIREHFKLSGSEIFTYGDTIYVPQGRLTIPLIAHEEVHCRQQGDDPEGWWQKYTVDLEFRFAQELEAHRAEYWKYCEKVKHRGRRHKMLVIIASRLASPLYGRLCTVKEAVKLIRSKS